MDRPAASATRADWDEYAESLGLDPEEYGNKDDLIAAVDDAEEAGGTDSSVESKAERSDAWQAAYDHALSIPGNTEKTAAIFADQNFQTDEFSA
jgi:hypothetical protein